MAKRRVRRVILVGIDGAMLSLALRFIDQGLMPHLKRHMERGVVAEALPSIPADTPTNWTTIASGAEPATHGIFSFTSHLPGEPMMAGEHDPLRNKQATSSQAELIWTTAARQGLSSAVLNYPTGWPSLHEQQIVLGGVTPGGEPWRVSKSRVFATGEPVHTKLTLPTAQISYVSLSPKPKPDGLLWDEITIGDSSAGFQERLHVMIRRDAGGSYGSLDVLRDGERLCTLRPGEWSPWLKAGPFGDQVVYRLKLVHLSSDARHLELYCTDVVRASGWSYPEELASELFAKVGPYVEGFECPYVPVDQELRSYGPANVSYEIILEQAGYQVQWLTRAAEHVASTRGFDLLFLHFHLIDLINHTLLGYLDEDVPYSTPKLRKDAWDFYAQAYRVVDELVGNMISAFDDGETTIAVLSDHGALPCWRYVSIVEALRAAQLVQYDWDAEAGTYRININRSLAVPYLDPQHIWVNLEGREPEGIVPRRDYEAVRQRIIDALYAIRDPETGDPVIQLACRREDLCLSGASAERVGDVVFFLRPGYSTWDGMIDSLRSARLRPERVGAGIVMPLELVVGHHTPYLPTARYKTYENSSMSFWGGAGIRSGYRRSYPHRLTDVAPTFAHLLGISGPVHAEGGVLWDFLGD
ncbi:MAG: hypothetical protein GXP39_16390 [Chloroflexi bacterium]|nr:hypothetical protein [Chloroflexota bacterium]